MKPQLDERHFFLIVIACAMIISLVATLTIIISHDTVQESILSATPTISRINNATLGGPTSAFEQSYHAINGQFTLNDVDVLATDKPGSDGIMRVVLIDFTGKNSTSLINQFLPSDFSYVGDITFRGQTEHIGGSVLLRQSIDAEYFTRGDATTLVESGSLNWWCYNNGYDCEIAPGHD